MNTAEKKEIIQKIKKYMQTFAKIKVFCKGKKENMILWSSDDNKYIYYEHFGRSAIKNNISELTWIINNILGAKKQEIEFEVVGA